LSKERKKEQGGCWKARKGKGKLTAGEKNGEKKKKPHPSCQMKTKHTRPPDCAHIKRGLDAETGAFRPYREKGPARNS